MSFNYALTANQQTPTSDSKVILCKSFKINIAAGSGFLSGTTYDLGWLPKEAQVVAVSISVGTAVSGGTVSVATLAVGVGGNLVTSGRDVFTLSSSMNVPGSSYMNNISSLTDQKVTYTPTLTGAGATTGVVYINLFYVV